MGGEERHLLQPIAPAQWDEGNSGDEGSWVLPCCQHNTATKQTPRSGGIKAGTAHVGSVTIPEEAVRGSVRDPRMQAACCCCCQFAPRTNTTSHTFVRPPSRPYLQPSILQAQFGEKEG